MDGDEPLDPEDAPSELPGRAVAGAASAVAGAFLLTTPMAPLAPFVSAMTVPFFERVVTWDREGWRRFARVVDDGMARAGADPSDLPGWSDSDPGRFGLVLEIAEGARQAKDDAVLRGLARALANAYSDDARIDMERLYVAALRELRPPDVRVLEVLVDNINPDDNFDGVLAFDSDGLPPFQIPSEGSREFSIDHLSAKLPHLAEGMEFVIAALTRAGCVKPGTPRGAYTFPVQFYVATQFGRSCMAYLRDVSPETR